MTTADVIYWRGRCMEAEALAHYRSFENSFLRAAIPDGTPIPDIAPPPFQPYEVRIAELQAKLEKATSIAERWENGTIKQLQDRVATLAETCAKIAETVGIPYGPWQREASQDNFDTGARYARMYIAGAIRALAANQTPTGKGNGDGNTNLDRNRSGDGLRADVADVLTPSPIPGSPSAGAEMKPVPMAAYNWLMGWKPHPRTGKMFDETMIGWRAAFLDACEFVVANIASPPQPERTGRERYAATNDGYVYDRTLGRLATAVEIVAALALTVPTPQETGHE